MEVSTYDLCGFSGGLHTYDRLYRLTEERATDAARGDRTTSWTFDAVGNRQTQIDNGVLTSYVYDNNDRLLEENGPEGIVTYAFDQNGNTLEKQINGLIDTTYAYDRQDRLIQADTGTATINYAYDAMGIRQSKTENGTLTEFLVDSNRDYAQVIEEQGPTDSIIYLRGDDLISQARASTVSTYHADGQGSTKALTDAAGNTTDRFIYTAYGELAHREGTTDSDFLYTGEQFDEGVGFYYLRARYYNPSNGRFPTMDTYQGRVGEPQTLHKYLYVHADPINNIDPSGNITLGGLMSGVNAASTLYTVADIGFQIYTGNYVGAGAQIVEEVVYSRFGGAYGKRIAEFSQRQLSLLYRVAARSLSKPLRLGQPASARVLTHNLNALGVKKPAGSQAHHIVGGSTKVGRQTRARLEALGIDVNSPTNGVFLPGCGQSSAIGMVHCGRHTRAYEEAVREVIMNAGDDKVSVINALSEIRNELLNNTFTPLNRRAF